VIITSHSNDSCPIIPARVDFLFWTVHGGVLDILFILIILSLVAYSISLQDYKFTMEETLGSLTF